MSEILSELNKKVSAGKVFFSITALLLTLLPMFFKDSPFIISIFNKIRMYEISTEIEQVNKISSLEPLNTRFNLSDGSSVSIIMPRAYMILGNKFKADGVLTDVLATNFVNFFATLPDLEPFKVTEESNQQIKDDLLRMKRGESVYNLLRGNTEFVSISLTSFFPTSYDNALEINEKIANRNYKELPPEIKNGLLVYDTKVAIPSELNGRRVYFYKAGLIAIPENKENYPPMIFYCEAICTIVSNYNNKFGLAVSFHSAHIDKWQNIWNKANSKVSVMLKE